MTSDMQSTVAALIASGKGILAADESIPTIEERFTAVNIVSTEETRRAYREMLFTTPRLGACISGAILFDETIRQRTTDGRAMAEVLAKQGVIPGIKVDKHTSSLAAFAGEQITEGLDGLRDRLIEYRELGARFTKWRAVIAIGEHLPTRTCIEVNARALALFAALSQEAGLAPIVEPEILMDGSHTIARCEEVATTTLQRVFVALCEHRVTLETMLLKTGMVVSGADCPLQADVTIVAETTVRCLRRAVPAAVLGIVFLSGGQDAVTATERLNAICRAGHTPWGLSFSFGRALQTPALSVWKGLSSNIATAQAALLHRAQCNSAAVQGTYSVQMERANA